MKQAEDVLRNQTLRKTPVRLQEVLERLMQAMGFFIVPARLQRALDQAVRGVFHPHPAWARLEMNAAAKAAGLHPRFPSPPHTRVVDSLGTGRRDTAATLGTAGAPRRRLAGAAPLQEEEEKHEEEADDEEEDAGEEEKEEAWLLERFYRDR